MITNRRLELMLLKRSKTCILNDNGYKQHVPLFLHIACTLLRYYLTRVEVI